MSTILIVDDRVINRDLVTTVLTQLGHSVLEADDGSGALELVRHDLPDLVITDVLMPAMDGYEFVRALRANPVTNHLPVIFYSSHHLEEESRPIAEALGVVGVVNKSGDIRALLDAVTAALGLSGDGDARTGSSIVVDGSELDRERLRLLNAKLIEKIAQLEATDAIARDLHDTVIQRLFAVGMRMQGLRRHLPSDEALRLDMLVTEMDETIGDIRNTIHALRASNTSSDLRVRIQRVVDQTPGILGYRAGLSFAGPVNTVVPSEAHPHIVATVREALSNAARHAGATRVAVEIRADARTFSLRVIDDGIGLSGSRTESGLANLRVRAEELGGTMSVAAPAVGTGTCITWSFPIAARTGTHKSADENGGHGVLSHEGEPKLSAERPDLNGSAMVATGVTSSGPGRSKILGCRVASW